MLFRSPMGQEHKQHKDFPPTKTQVYSGNGKKVKSAAKAKHKFAIASDQDKSDVVATFPTPRDVMKEHFLLSELRTRIRVVVGLRDEEEFRENHDESQEIMDEGMFDNDNTTAVCENNAISGDVTETEIHKTVDKKQVTTNMFLGASGSLLAELKKSMATTSLQGTMDSSGGISTAGVLYSGE